MVHSKLISCSQRTRTSVSAGLVFKPVVRAGDDSVYSTVDLIFVVRVSEFLAISVRTVEFLFPIFNWYAISSQC